MLGNDIISICCVNNLKSFERERYLQLCFNPNEREQIKLSERITPFILWSAKESAYKSAVKSGLTDRFNPIEFSCFISPEKYSDDYPVSGYVLFREQNLSFFSEITNQYVHTICPGADSIENVNKFVIQIASSEIPQAGQFLKQQLCEKLKIETKIIDKTFTIINDNKTSVPCLFIDDKICQHFDISLSHDGIYLASCYSSVTQTI
jgi:hypothetical protein